MSDKHIYDRNGDYVGRISDKAPSTPDSPISGWHVAGVTIVWALISLATFPWGTLGFVIPTWMAHSYWAGRSSSEVRFLDFVVLIAFITCYGHLLTAAYILWK